MIETVLRHGGFTWLAEGSAERPARPADWPATRYEAKALAAGRRCTYLPFRRKGEPLPCG
jgi:tRNA (guanine-N7-)-methyltransferase